MNCDSFYKEKELSVTELKNYYSKSSSNVYHYISSLSFLFNKGTNSFTFKFVLFFL
jgi:hypothetical protein